MRCSLTSRGIPEFYVLAEFSSKQLWNGDLCSESHWKVLLGSTPEGEGRQQNWVAWGAKVLCSHSKDLSRSWGDSRAEKVLLSGHPLGKKVWDFILSHWPAIVHELLWEWGLTLEEEVLFNKKQIPKWDSARICQLPTAQGEVRSGLLTAAWSIRCMHEPDRVSKRSSREPQVQTRIF